MQSIVVRPGDNEIKNAQVAFWECSKVHYQADSVWEQHSGALVIGDPMWPNAMYVVADTEAVRVAIKQGRLVVVVEAEPIADTALSLLTVLTPPETDSSAVLDALQEREVVMTDYVVEAGVTPTEIRENDIEVDPLPTIDLPPTVEPEKSTKLTKSKGG